MPNASSFDIRLIIFWLVIFLNINIYLKPIAVDEYEDANILHILSSSILSKLSIISRAEDLSEFIIERILIIAFTSSGESGKPIFLKESAKDGLRIFIALHKFSQNISCELSASIQRTV